MAGLVFHFSANLANYICQLRIHGWRVVNGFSYRTFRKYEKGPLGRTSIMVKEKGLSHRKATKISPSVWKDGGKEESIIQSEGVLRILEAVDHQL